MSNISHSALMRFTDIEILETLIEDDERANRKPFRNDRGARHFCVDKALVAAYEALPEGKEKNTLAYIISHPCAEFHFSKTDAVHSAIEEALKIIKKIKTLNS